jgi:plastocyanin
VTALLNNKSRRWRNVGQALVMLGALFGASPSSEAQTKSKVHHVAIDAMQFSPRAIEVKVGDTVIWENRDPFPHTVTSENRSFDSGQIGPNRSWKFIVRSRGDFSYVCTLHPTMKGRLASK